jgi:NAD(P)-dependent dehydrogenase (short-subunit alcohol dehydrogenase family)
LPGRLDGKVAVITGGASGMGRATSLLFSREGAAVVVADINDEGGEQVAGECVEAGGRAVFQHTDVTEEEQIVAMIRRAVDEYGRLDVLYNNAGGSRAVGFDAPTEDWDYDHKLNVRAAYLGIKHAAPELRQAGGGSIISTASDNGIRTLPHTHAYATFKAGVIKLTESAAQVLGPDRIRVNAIAPGWIITPMLVGGLPGDWADAEAIGAKAQPYPRHGTPEDIARCALFLASDESEFVSGVTIPVDGAWLTLGLQTPACHAEIARVAGKAQERSDWLEQPT